MTLKRWIRAAVLFTTMFALTFTLTPGRAHASTRRAHHRRLEAVQKFSPWVQRSGKDGCWWDDPFSSPHLLFKSYDGINYLTETTTLTNRAGTITDQWSTVTAILPDSSERFVSQLPAGWYLLTVHRAQIEFDPNITPRAC